MHKNIANSIIETKWFYCGPDNEKYGPYLSKDMQFWLQAGYFNSDLQLRTEHEQAFRSLGEWNQLLGTHPFSTPVHSFEATANQLNATRPPPHGAAMMMMPPGLQAPFPPQMPMRFPPFLPMPLLHQMNPNGLPMNAQMHSQPPSEPIDAGSLSHTPDSENEFQGHIRKPLMHSNVHQMQQMITRTMDAHTATEPVVMKNAECQTDPLKVELSKANASRLLSELFGQIVVIN